jgi:hypothetical protein
MLHLRGFANTALDLLGPLKGVKRFDRMKGCWIRKENMRLAANDITWILLLWCTRHDYAL